MSRRPPAPAIIHLSEVRSTVGRIDTVNDDATIGKPTGQRGTVVQELALLRDFIKLRRAESSRRLAERMRMLAGACRIALDEGASSALAR